MTCRTPVAVAALALAMAPCATAQEPTIDLATIDLSVPDSPAFHILGVTAESASRPSSPRQLSLELLNGVDENGNLKTGIAIDTAPFILFKGDETTLDQYQSDDVLRILWNTQVSVATAKGAGDDDESLRLALGLRTVLFDEGDPRQDPDLTKCIKDALSGADLAPLQQESDDLDRQIIDLDRKIDEAVEEDNQTVLIELLAERDELVAKRALLDQQLDEALDAGAYPGIQACQEDSQFRSNNWNASSAAIGVGPTFDSEDGGLDEIDFGGSALYGSWAIRVQDYAQVILGARFASNELVALNDETEAFDEVDRATAAARVRVGSEGLNFFGEAAFIHEDGDVLPSDEYWKLAVGADFRVANDLWLSLGLGGDVDRDFEENSFALANLKWAFSPTPAFAPR